ncbi:VOC family protein [Janthinobacterium agaricidamnosum]|uniref:PhnB-like domain-containing protein n=1 Tax=Janthinobacterium agaricidamnosum NBRC 102515 = DSM 9628 TaxID=1349767 RepID=W0V653_9BURK|nr:glyoxalase/bleomycin resistance/extradiol dioxygenase family protein [Janthinobacterium agaricidamnosum]CDG84309.1 putative uncharacterized protein [Janthinobacterium agaricidamnosum NBRC 102515 = DSM 9628]
MDINPYLQFNGNCAQAFTYYRQHLGGQELTLMPFRGSPAEDQVEGDWKDKIMHGSIKIGNTTLMGSDTMCAETGAASAIQGCSISIHLDDPAEAERLFNTLAERGKTTMALEKTFWARKFGTLTDQFGVPWMINCE